MKQRKNFFALLIGFVTLILLSNSINLTAKEANEHEAIKSYENLISLFKAESKDYPDYYGGGYLNEDGNLVLLTKKGEKINDKANKVLSNFSNEVVYKQVEYSYNDLKEVQKLFRGKMNEYGINATGIDIINNRVDVYMTDVNNEKIKNIKELSKIPCINIIEAKFDIKFTATELIAGNTVNTPPSNHSLGFSAEYNNRAGIVVAGHAVTMGEDVYYNNHLVGEVTNLAFGGSSDAAFVEIDSMSDWIPTGKIRNGEQFYSWSDFDYVPINVSVKRHGKSSGTRSGKVVQHDFDFEIDGINFYDMVLTDAYAELGDSGGPFTSYSPVYGDVYLRGTQSAVLQSEDGEFYYSVASNIDNIVDNLDLDYIYLE